jgi:uncharacterized protein (TIGR00369 family)
MTKTTAEKGGRIDEAAARAAFEHALAGHEQNFGTFFLAKLLGLEVRFTETTCIVETELRDFLFNPQGSLHGGIIATILDISMGHLLNHKVGPGVTLEMKIQFARAVRAGHIRCEAAFIKQGRSVNFLEAKLTDAEGRIVAAATSTWQLMATPEASARDHKAL